MLGVPCLTHPGTHTVKHHPPLHARSAYVVGDAEVAAFQRHMDAYLSRLHDPNVAVRRGYASALGALPGRLLQGRAEEVCVCQGEEGAVGE